jgi:copper oxidase (laccase) domain-containing protein
VTGVFSFLETLSKLDFVKAAWLGRQPGIEVAVEREQALENLAPQHDKLVAGTFPEIRTRHHAEQVHGNRVAVITEAGADERTFHAGVDGLITQVRGQLLGIYVADCAAIYLADTATKSIALLHSGKKGTEGNILGEAVTKMAELYGTDPADLVCVVSPCIRPPDYEIDFAATIAEQAAVLGIGKFHDSCQNTAADLATHYSYRIEQGKTGRMLALLALD